MAVGALNMSAMAAVTPDSQPKDWPANATKHVVKIKREAADKKQAELIAAAEAAQPSKEELQKAAGVPAGEKVWWHKEEIGIRIPFAITADAVAYYSELVAKYGRQEFKRYIEPSSKLDYHAAVKFHREFKLGDKTFTDVHVVTLKLVFDENFAASGTEGMHFEKERVVVLDAAGKVLHVSGDGPTETAILAI